MHRSFVMLVVVVALFLGVFPAAASPTVETLRSSQSDNNSRPVIFFASDGLRQDLVALYSRRGDMRNLEDLLRHGAKAGDSGLLTQSPPNTGAGWYTLATGAWPGVHGSTNNTFHVNGTAFTGSTSAFTPGILQAETIAQAA
jgi:predicted AlkP superfamily phosphohydrolase/phosphomutase